MWCHPTSLPQAPYCFRLPCVHGGEGWLRCVDLLINMWRSHQSTDFFRLLWLEWPCGLSYWGYWTVSLKSVEILRCNLTDLYSPTHVLAVCDTALGSCPSHSGVSSLQCAFPLKGAQLQSRRVAVEATVCFKTRDSISQVSVTPGVSSCNLTLGMSRRIFAAVWWLHRLQTIFLLWYSHTPGWHVGHIIIWGEDR